jgi:hypothetical protein
MKDWRILGSEVGRPSKFFLTPTRLFPKYLGCLPLITPQRHVHGGVARILIQRGQD